VTFATVEGTARYRERLAGRIDVSHFQQAAASRQAAANGQADGLWLSSIGLGTYLGEPDTETSSRYGAAIGRALDLGCNVIDTAINYRFQLSERAIGQALAQFAIPREEVFVSTKGGYVPYDGSFPEDPARYIAETFIDTGIARSEDFAQGGQHCMAAPFLAHQLAQSRANLQLQTIDLYYVHNPEGQLGEISRPAFMERLREAFVFLEQAASDGHIGGYGLATWNGFRQLPSARDYLSLAESVKLAQSIAGDAHHFIAIQLPVNLAMSEAFDNNNQQLGGAWRSTLDAARELGIMVFASASLLQARLSRNLPGAVRSAVGAGLSDAQRALQFTRSLPGVTSALVGMSSVRHVDENMLLAQRPRLTDAELKRVSG
jgi:aryl-alcohol dehydrogenase-like predicted oxidoreductase